MHLINEADRSTSPMLRVAQRLNYMLREAEGKYPALAYHCEWFQGPHVYVRVHLNWTTLKLEETHLDKQGMDGLLDTASRMLPEEGELPHSAVGYTSDLPALVAEYRSRRAAEAAERAKEEREVHAREEAEYHERKTRLDSETAGMKRKKITLRLKVWHTKTRTHEIIDVPAWIWDSVPGLCAHHLNGESRWIITHIGSGLRVGYSPPTLDAARIAIARFGQLFDWTGETPTGDAVEPIARLSKAMIDHGVYAE